MCERSPDGFRQRSSSFHICLHLPLPRAGLRSNRRSQTTRTLLRHRRSIWPPRNRIDCLLGLRRFPRCISCPSCLATQAEHIELRWGQANELRSVNFEFEPFRDFTRTKLTITEGSWPLTPAGAQEALGSQMGWTGMLSALKAWLEYGVNLRDGFYKQ